MRAKGEGGLHMEVRTQKCPFLHVFCDIFICWKLLPCFVVIGVDSHNRFIKHLLSLFSYLSNAFQSISLWNYLLDISKHPIRNSGGGRLKWYEYVCNRGARSRRTCAYDGEEGSNFCHFGAYVLIE